jgi:enoyl-CoA hydratase
MADEDPVLTERRDGVLLITLNRPDARNAINLDVAEGIAAALEELDADDELSVGVLTGAGKGFSAGMDLKAFVSGKRPWVEGRGFAGIVRRSARKPLIAAVEGFAVAGGLELAIWCDLRVLAADAVLGVFCRRFGVPLVDGGTVRLPRIVGHGRALDLILSGREVGADEALAIGLANRVVEPGAAREAAVEWGRELAALPQDCLRNDRLSALGQWGLSEEEALGLEYRYGIASLSSGEAVAGAQRFAHGAGRSGGTVDPPAAGTSA